MSKIFKSAFIEDSPFVLSNRSDVTKEAEKATSLLEIESERRSRKKADELMKNSIDEAERIKAEAEAESENYMVAAREQALQMKAEAHDEGYEIGKKQGFEEGYAAGIALADEEMCQKVLDAAERAEKLINFAEKSAKDTILSAEGQIVELSLQIAKRVISDKLTVDNTTIMEVVGAALTKVKGQEQIVVKLNQEDYDIILLQKDALQSRIGQENKLLFSVESNLHKGDCVIDTANGILDATVETKFAVIEKSIRELLK